MRRWLSPFERKRRRRKRLIVSASFLVGLAIVHALDRPVVAYFHAAIGDTNAWERSDWVQLFRSIGFLPTWLLIAGALVLADRVKGTAEDLWASGRRGIPLALGAALAGLGAEVFKVLVSRERPYVPRGEDTDQLARLGEHVWHAPLSDLWMQYQAGLGMPSSHTAVAFGGAFMLARLCPRVGPIALVAATGCGYTRVATGAHFLSDVYVAIWVAYAVVVFVSHRCPPTAVRDELARIEAARTRW